MFKRRRDETESAEARPANAAPPVTALFPEKRRPDAPTDNGLDVPPFRPVPIKEAPAMARSPFNATPSPSQLPPSASGIPPRPQSAPNPQSGPPQPGVAPPGMQPGLGQQAGRPQERQQERRTLVVGRGISLQGLIQDAERLVVEGTVEAQLLHAHELAVAPGGMFKGEVEVEDAEIAGTIDGAVTARGSLVIRGTGRVIGTARCRRLQVEDGGQISGKMEMITDGPSGPRGPDRAA